MKPTKPEKVLKAYRNPEFINGPDARPLRMMAEYLEPAARLRQHGVEDTIVFFGSARLREGNRYYEAARAVARHMTQWSKGLDPEGLRRFVVCTGGGPGIMEAANRGASEARGLNVGFTIALPHEEAPNAYITRELLFRFHYFFMRKFWLAYLAKALLVFPGGFGTLDEL
ncbi:MAG: LOG family protein, partial [Betaproteobacteria bacterium]